MSLKLIILQKYVLLGYQFNDDINIYYAFPGRFFEYFHSTICIIKIKNKYKYIFFTNLKYEKIIWE